MSYQHVPAELDKRGTVPTAIVEQILQMKMQGFTYRSIAEQFSLTPTGVYGIWLKFSNPEKYEQQMQKRRDRLKERMNDPEYVEKKRERSRKSAKYITSLALNKEYHNKLQREQYAPRFRSNMTPEEKDARKKIMHDWYLKNKERYHQRYLNNKKCQK